METITTEVILSRRKGLYNQVILYYVLPYVRQKKTRWTKTKAKQIGSTSENLCYVQRTWTYKKFRNLDLNEKKDGATTTWYGSSWKGNLQKKSI